MYARSISSPAAVGLGAADVWGGAAARPAPPVTIDSATTPVHASRRVRVIARSIVRPSPAARARSTASCAATTSSTAMPSDLKIVTPDAAMRPAALPATSSPSSADDVAVVDRAFANRQQQVAGFLERAGARVDVHARARDQRGRHFALIGPAGADRADVRARADVIARRSPARARPSRARRCRRRRTAVRRVGDGADTDRGRADASRANWSRCSALGLQTRTSVRRRT